jgi:hypothetical protein
MVMSGFAFSKMAMSSIHSLCWTGLFAVVQTASEAVCSSDQSFFLGLNVGDPLRPQVGDSRQGTSRAVFGMIPNTSRMRHALGRRALLH